MKKQRKTEVRTLREFSEELRIRNFKLGSRLLRLRINTDDHLVCFLRGFEIQNCVLKVMYQWRHSVWHWWCHMLYRWRHNLVSSIRVRFGCGCLIFRTSGLARKKCGSSHFLMLVQPRSWNDGYSEHENENEVLADISRLWKNIYFDVVY